MSCETYNRRTCLRRELGSPCSYLALARFQKSTPRRSDPAVDSFKCRRGYVSGLEDRSNRATFIHPVHARRPQFMIWRAFALLVVVQLLTNWVATGSAQQARPEQDSRGCLGGAIDRLSPRTTGERPSTRGGEAQGRFVLPCRLLAGEASCLDP